MSAAGLALWGEAENNCSIRVLLDLARTLPIDSASKSWTVRYRSEQFAARNSDANPAHEEQGAVSRNWSWPSRRKDGGPGTRQGINVKGQWEMQPLTKDEIRSKVAASALGAAHTARRVLRKTADLIEQRGWAQGRFEDADGRLCIHGAIHLVVSGLAVRNDRDRDSLSTAAWHQFREYLLAEGV
jgi:hypothetical protein